ncbi:MAG: PorP/SprF family type IX secretion system membrane protein, partial [Chitinophagaceae bacterium]
FYETPLLRIPARAGIFTGDVRVQAVYRNQWQSVTYPYRTSALSAEYKFPVGYANDFLTIGLQTFYDVAGIARLSTAQVMPALNFHKALNEEKNSFLSAGFMAGYVQRYFNDKNLTFDNQYTGGQYNPSAPSGENFAYLKRGFADYAAGLSFSSSLANAGNYYIGVSLFHLTKPSETFMNKEFVLMRKFQANAGVKAAFNDDLQFRGEVNFLKQGPFTEIMLGGLATYHITDMYEEGTNIKSVSVSGGLFLRLNDAAVPVVKLNYNNFEVGMSYDANISKLTTASRGRGGYELSLSYKGFLSGYSSTHGLITCPVF